MEELMDRLLWALHPDRSIHPFRRRTDAALESFRRPPWPVTTLPGLVDVLVPFYGHVWACLLGLSAPLRQDANISWSNVREILQKAYGPAGTGTGLEMARTGVNGGLAAVLRAVANQMADDASRKEIQRQVTGFWNLLSAAGWLATSPLLMQRLESLLPPELIKGITTRIQAYPQDFLNELPQLLLDLENRMPLP